MAVAPRDCLVIEDSLTGIRAALAAGIEVWRFTGGSHMDPDAPPEPEDARAARQLAAFDEIFRVMPELARTP